MNVNLQKAFKSAVAAVGTQDQKSTRQMPIYRRPERNEMQAVKDAASALSALWKMNTPNLNHR